MSAEQQIPAYRSDAPLLEELQDEPEFRNLSRTQQILAYNKRWARRPEIQDIVQRTREKQSPKILWLGCADSRVPEAAVCGTMPGEIFVHRNIANCFHPGDLNASAVLAYAIDVLSVENIIVVGHIGCGGINAALQAAQQRHDIKYDIVREGSPEPPSYLPVFGEPDTGAALIAKWLGPLKSLAVAQLKTDAAKTMSPEEAHAALVKTHVAAQVSNIESSPIIQRALCQGKKISVDGWVYDVNTGEMVDLRI